ncbi:hypothetical protein PCG10_001639 [Penicillium crustosum]|uniref:Xylanolytic transcriptional activator regulatory domain-containing protein n=1 Tax=Penicillium crustosum TaxID=36656 RepID=A0A9P5GAN6_PENCR|nr:hypothetical protein PCG10_001639 [Penicillium crustosum]
MPSPAGSGGSSATAGPSEASTGVGTELPNIGEIFRDQLEHRRPSVARPSSAPRVMRLSSLEEAEKLSGQYFNSMGYQYPFLSRPEFMANLRHIYTGGVPSPETHHTYHIVIAISLLIGSADPSQAAEFYHASQETLPLALQNEDLPAVRALLGLALYTMFATAGPSIWHVLGATMRLSISMGLHKARPYPSIAEEEMAKRAFWSLYNLDRLIASTLGRPLGIADDDISVGLLRELNDDETEAPGASAMTIPLQVTRLRRIFSRIYQYCITILWCLEQNARSLRESQPSPWHPEEQTMRRGIQAVVVLLEEFGKRRPGVDRLAETFRHQSTVIFSQMAYQQQQLEQQQHHHHPQHQPQLQPPPPPALLPPHPMSLAAPPPPPVPLAPVLDDVLLVDGSGTVPMIDPQMAEQLFYSYNWFQEEMASYYTL